ncbi:MAG TPA: pyrroline-5-carboxylate reductase [Usitatibacter sp.]|nr:pyrroline-5-carboxylate reductase [Usitatibacter sp.]
MKLVFIGGGNMATAILGGLLAKGVRASDVMVVDVDSNVRVRLLSQFGVHCFESPGPEMADAEVVVFAVKPQQMREAAQKVAAACGNALFVSIAAGIRLGDLSRWLGGRKRLVRAMPNTPALVHAGITGLHAPEGVPEKDRQAAEGLLSAVGATVWFENEGDLDAVTAVSGSGPAYVFYAIEALEAAARNLGLAEGASRSLALWTFVGAAKLAIERGVDPATLRAQVTSKGGTTERALEVLEGEHVKQSFVDAVAAACERSRELGAAFGKD